MFMLRGRARELFSISISNGYLFRSSHYIGFSTASSSNTNEAQKTHFMVDYLITSVGFSTKEAISVSSKVTRLKSTQNPDLVITIFKEYGLEKTQIREIVSSVPKVLTCNANKTLEPKIRVLRDYGFSVSDLVDFMKANPNFLKVGFQNRVIPLLEYFRQLMSSNEEAIGVATKSKWLFSSSSTLKRLSANVLQLQNRGVSSEKIAKFIAKSPRYARSPPALFERRLHWIVEELGIPENSPMFIYAVHAVSWLSKSSMRKKFEVFRSYGWSKEEIISFARIQPYGLSLSDAKITNGLNYFMNELGYTPAYLTSCGFILGLSLENRVKPRYKVLEILKEKKLLKKKPPALVTVVCYSELKFLAFVKRFENEIPSLLETYTSSMGKTPKCLPSITEERGAL